MHEMALTKDIVDTVLEYVQRAEAKRVHAVYLRIGYARDVVDELLQSCFTYYARGTQAEGAQLVVWRVPVTMRCNACGCVFPINLNNRSTWVCPSCGAHDYRSNTGMEFMIDRIEVA